ncbi:MAG: ROK family protein [Candidatus Omnitrophota bacterium]|nr:ROK family protein [Candidatus Omnitrophota bacterium]
MTLGEGVLKRERFTEKERRNLAILDIIRRTREVSRAEISKITHLNIVTISNYIDDYIAKGLVLEKGYDVSTGGRRPELLEINSKFGYTIGIDLGSPHIMEDSCIVGTLVDTSGRIICKVKVRKEEENQEKFINRIMGIVRDLYGKSKVEKARVKGVGVAIWGVLDRYKGTVRYAVEKGGIFSYAALQSAIEREFDTPTLVEHDATAGALGEKWMGLGLSTEAENILYMCSDSSCGLILSGELYYGASKSAGELNINPPSPDYKDDNCWAKYDYGCGFRSRGIDLGISSRAKSSLSHKGNGNSKILQLVNGRIDSVSLNTVIEAARFQDKLAMELLTEAGDYLGAKIAFLINLFNPDSIVIGRGMEKGGDIFMDAVRKSVKKWAYEESLKVARIVPASLGEDSIACGASALVMQQVFARI